MFPPKTCSQLSTAPTHSIALPTLIAYPDCNHLKLDHHSHKAVPHKAVPHTLASTANTGTPRAHTTACCKVYVDPTFNTHQTHNMAWVHRLHHIHSSHVRFSRMQCRMYSAHCAGLASDTVTTCMR
jgi:hypothetical protein